MKMTEDELISKVLAADSDAISYRSELNAINMRLENMYIGAPWREVAGRSTYISTDVQDVVESDMPTLVRIFLGSNDILKFKPNSTNMQEVKEANEKTKYVHHIIRNQQNAFGLYHGFMKTAELKKAGILRYDYVERKSVKEIDYKNLSPDEFMLLVQEFEEEVRADSKTDFKLIKEEDNDDGTKTIRVKITRKDKKVEITSIRPEQFVIDRNATCKDDAEIIGDDQMISRSDLVAAGYDRKLVDSLPVGSQSVNRSVKTTGTSSRTEVSNVDDPASDLILVSTRLVKLDADGDGIAERIRVVYAGSILLEQQKFEHVNYAILSSILEPNNAIGRSRGELAEKAQEVKTVLFRGMLDNSYAVMGGRTVVNTSNNAVNIDDVLTQRPNGIIRVKGDVRQAVAQLETPYIADKMMLTNQQIDANLANKTGSLMLNQGLQQDQINDETATGFNGRKEKGAEKIELVVRVFAETGFKELAEGIAWTVSHYQDEATEILVLGKPLTVDPRKWRYDHIATSKVGLAAGDNEDTINNMTGLMTIQQQLMTAQSPLVDSKKLYNSLSRIIIAMGESDIEEFFNNPDIPEEMLFQQNEMLNQQLAQAMDALEQLQQKNPLAEAEQIRAEATLLKAQMTEQGNSQQKQIDLAKVLQQQKEFNAKLEEDQRQFNIGMLQKFNEMEQKYKADLGVAPPVFSPQIDPLEIENGQDFIGGNNINEQ